MTVTDDRDASHESAGYSEDKMRLKSSEVTVTGGSDSEGRSRPRGKNAAEEGRVGDRRRVEARESARILQSY